MTPFEICSIGTGSVRVNANRGGPGHVVEIGNEKILIDCGRCTVHNLERFGYRAEHIDTVLITHLHFDHVCDLPYFVLLGWNNGRTKRLRFFGPPGLKAFLKKAILEAYHDDIGSRLGHGKDSIGIEWTVTELSEDGAFLEQDTFTLSTVRTEHAHMANFNFRVDVDGRSAIVTSDTNPDDVLKAFCRDADLMISECSGTREFLLTVPWGSWHMWPEKLAEIATAAQVKRVVISHLVIENWTDDPAIAERMAATVRLGYPGRVDVAHDGMRYVL